VLVYLELVDFETVRHVFRGEDQFYVVSLSNPDNPGRKLELARDDLDFNLF